MEDILFKLGVFVVGIPSLYFLLTAKTFFRRLALLGTIAAGVAVWLLQSGSEDREQWSFFSVIGEWLGWVGFIGFVFLMISVILDWLFNGD